jgi:EAL domain-containing protein (putative c-di-GMP-specific phosphodiesterase class I)
MRVIAEGVEIESQRETLAGLDCDGYQGWLHSRAVPAEECFRMLVGDASAEKCRNALDVMFCGEASSSRNRAVR